MTRLILTADSSSAAGLKLAGRADIAVALEPRLVWGPIPSQDELAAFVAVRSIQKPGSHWPDHVSPGHMNEFGGGNFGLIELCQRCETIELWFEPKPNAQLVLIWLLDYLHSHADTAIIAKLILFLVDSSLGGVDPKALAKWRFPTDGVTNDHLEIASLAWRAYRAPTPLACFDLLNRDLSVLPQLRRRIVDLLEELPARATGLGASETRILELISAGYTHPFDLFPHYKQRFQRHVFGYWEVGALLDGLALAPVPAISGLAEFPFTIEMHESSSRLKRYKESRLSLTALGKALLTQADNFSGHNPIDRWWGGTRLTNDHLWRCNPVLIEPGH
jgi:hypothetical protein